MFQQPAKVRISSLLMQTSISLGTLRCIGAGELKILFECFSLILVLYKSTVPSQTVIFLILNVQPLTVDKTDLRTRMEVMYRVMKSAAPFTSYTCMSTGWIFWLGKMLSCPGR